ncbi:MAG: ParB/RepB/Spo0J family partition protein [Rickettsiaceae bacterium]|nr:ParB/RepB/Spo0J family partition protein [Rickettsiaceae bacterium]
MTSKILGRGLSSLLREEVVPIQKKEFETYISIKKLKANENQPRKNFDDDRLQELSESIKRHGVLQPILVRTIKDGTFEIIAGERRYRASMLAGLERVPIIIKDLSECEILEIALIENIQREELNIIEEAESYQKLINNFGYSQQQLATVIGKSRSHIANLLRICSLSSEIKQFIIEHRLSMGHARCLVGIEENKALELANKTLQEEWSVRKLEKVTADSKNDIRTDKNLRQSLNSSKVQENEDIKLLAQALSDKLGVKVTIENSGNVGSISFHYNSLEELDAILTKIN